MILFPNCKINIGLDLTGKRNDGYHEIRTLMFPVTGLCDSVEIIPDGAGRATLSTSGPDPGVPADDNLCMRIYRMIGRRFDTGGVSMHLHKRIPSGAGLGGGSADAAFTIKGLDECFGLGLSEAVMEDLAAEVGSDVPFFIKNIPAMSTGRGEILKPHPMPVLEGMHLVIIKYGHIDISTRRAYAGITPRVPSVPLEERLAADISTWKDSVTNAFEESVFPRYPLLAGTKQALYDAGAVYASMSGSGSAVYGLFAAEPEIPEVPENAFVYQQVIVQGDII